MLFLLDSAATQQDEKRIKSNFPYEAFLPDVSYAPMTGVKRHANLLLRRHLSSPDVPRSEEFQHRSGHSPESDFGHRFFEFSDSPIIYDRVPAYLMATIPDERKSPARHSDPRVDIFQSSKAILIPRLDFQKTTPR